MFITGKSFTISSTKLVGLLAGFRTSIPDWEVMWVTGAFARRNNTGLYEEEMALSASDHHLLVAQLLRVERNFCGHRPETEQQKN